MGQEQAAGLIQNDAFLKKAYHAAVSAAMLSIISGCINIIVDGILVGRQIGAGALAAVNFCVPANLVLCIVGSFFVSGAAICASYEIGRNRMDAAASFYKAALTICALASLVIMVFGVIFTDRIAVFLCKDGEILQMVEDYAFVTFVGAFFKIMIYVPFWFLRLDGKNRAAAVMMAIMAVGNVALDLLFLIVFQMGVAGAAWASLIATVAACVYGFSMQQMGNGIFKLGILLPDMEDMRRISETGSPAAMNNALQTLRLLAVNSLFLKYAGSMGVAEFGVINGISAFAEAVTVGVPQAGCAIMGICHGESDNSSACILLKLETKMGMAGCVLAGCIMVAEAGLIQKAYGLQTPLVLPLVCLAASLFPALWNNILSFYYNVAEKLILSNLIIAMRVLVCSVSSLFALFACGASPWFFLIAGEALTILIWLAVVSVLHRRDAMSSRFFLMDEALEKQGRVINFSMEGDPEKICDASVRITSFCTENGMSSGQVMRISLAIEEMLMLIAGVNGRTPVSFDIRVFAVGEETGIRIRYGGFGYNPLGAAKRNGGDEMYMGIRMIEKLMKKVVYQSVLGMNTLIILL